MYFLVFILWVVLSGSVTPEVIAVGAVITLLLYLFRHKVLGHDDHFQLSEAGKLKSSLRYLGFLLVEILKASLVVMKLIYTRGKDTKPVLVYFQSGLKTDEARVALANSITLTAGTITVLEEDGRFCVHSLDRSLAAGIENSEFERRLKTMEH